MIASAKARLHNGCMSPVAPKADWLSSFPAGPRDKEGFARIVDADGGRGDAENSYYEEAGSRDQLSSNSPSLMTSMWRLRVLAISSRNRV
jgi:hypothetical protein